MPGIIRLYTNQAKINKGGMKIKEVYYYTPKNRKSIIESWIILYGDRFDKMYVHIIPSIEKNYSLHRELKVIKNKNL